MLLFLGDVVPYKPFKFNDLHKTIINLECPITTIGIPITGKINISVRETYLNSIFNGRLACVSLANNHIMDYGLGGLNSTLSELKKFNIDYFGLNTPEDENHNPLIFEYNDIKIALISAICESTSPVIEFDDYNYLNLLNEHEMINKITAVRDLVDRIVLYIHWGIEDSSYPSKEDVVTARKLIDAGVDIVVGSHAHAPQPVERYGNGIIAYNLGNFIMPAFKDMPSYFNEEGVAQSDFSKRLMLWNRTSWGLLVDMKTLEYAVKKYIFLANRIVEVKVSPLDKYLKLLPDISDPTYDSQVMKHLKKRAFQRKLRNFIHNPHIPGTIRRK